MALVLLLTTAAGPDQPQPDPRQSLGGYASTTAVDSARPVHNLFGGVDRAGCETGGATHRVLVLANTGASGEVGRDIWISDDVVGGAALGIALDPLGVLPLTQLLSALTADGSVAPAGITYSSPRSQQDALTTPSIPAGSGIALHLRRSTPSGVPETANDGATLTHVPISGA